MCQSEGPQGGKQALATPTVANMEDKECNRRIKHQPRSGAQQSTKNTMMHADSPELVPVVRCFYGNRSANYWWDAPSSCGNIMATREPWVLLLEDNKDNTTTCMSLLRASCVGGCVARAIAPIGLGMQMLLFDFSTKSSYASWPPCIVRFFFLPGLTPDSCEPVLMAMMHCERSPPCPLPVGKVHVLGMPLERPPRRGSGPGATNDAFVVVMLSGAWSRVRPGALVLASLPFRFCHQNRDGGALQGLRVATGPPGPQCYLLMPGAFNHVSRQAMLEGMRSRPELALCLAFAKQVYGANRRYIWVDDACHSHIITQREASRVKAILSQVSNKLSKWDSMTH